MMDRRSNDFLDDRNAKQAVAFSENRGTFPATNSGKSGLGYSIWVMGMTEWIGIGNGIRLGTGQPAASLRFITLLPSVPRPDSFRNGIADAMFVALVLCSRCAFVAGGVLGGSMADVRHKGRGILAGLIVGAIVRLWLRRSLGVRGGNPTFAFYSRLRERGDGDPRRMLESLVEATRGTRFTPLMCRQVTAAYAAARRELQTCGSATERNDIHRRLCRRTLAILYEPGDSAGKVDYEPQVAGFKESPTQTASSVVPLGKVRGLRPASAGPLPSLDT